MLVVAALSATASQKPQNWLEVRSPHFQVVTNSNVKQARRIAHHFEQIRAVFHQAFPNLRVDPSAPIIALVAKDEKTFKTLVPESWLQKGQLQRSGMFSRGEEKNYVLIRADAPGDNPDSIIFHEYTHLLLSQSGQPVPLWVDEGVAEFYGNSEIHAKEVWLGRPSASDLQLLQQNKLLPLATLFAVDYSSPYYNEQNKGSIFYAQSWALAHLLMLKELEEKHNRLGEFLSLLGQDVDATTAARRVFGDLRKLQTDLEVYVRQPSFHYLRMKGATEVDEEAFQVRDLSPAESAAVRGDFLAHNQRYEDARRLLQESLRQSPNYAPAHESMGFLELQQGHQQEAKRWFTQAVKLDSQSYLAHYYYAVMSLQGTQDSDTSRQVEESLRAAIRINPNFAPAYATLASFYGMRGANLEEAHRLALTAAQLEPGNVRYVLNVASVLLRMNDTDNAVRVGEHALSLAKSAEEHSAADSFLESARQYQQYLAAQKQAEERGRIEAKKVERELAAPGTLTRREAAPPEAPETKVMPEPRKAQTALPSNSPRVPRRQPTQAPRWAASGRITAVSCASPASMDLTLHMGTRTLLLHASNYLKVDFLTTYWKPPDPFHPCEHIKGMWARVVYAAVQGKQFAGELISVEVQK